MNKFFLCVTLLSIFLFSCKVNEKDKKDKKDRKSSISFDDSKYVINNNYKVGDVRRYGIFPDSSYVKTHPFTKKLKLHTVLDLAENHGVELFFPQGYYGRNLILDNRKNITISFDKAAFNLIHITSNGKEESVIPENIILKGKLISYDRLGITYAKNISIDTVYIKTNLSKSNRKSRGCHIYCGTKNISINYLEIDDFGSGGPEYKHNHAALAIDCMNDNPNDVQIKKIHIKSTDRHGIYITGNDHLIGDVIIDKFGVGSSKDMSGMQDADNEKGEHIEFKALWINKCYNSFIENITINEKGSKAKYTAHFDSGDKLRPFTIGTFKVVNDNPNISNLEEANHGVIVEIID